MHYDSSLDAGREQLDELVVLLNLVYAIVLVEVLEVIIDLSVQNIGQRFVFPESGQKSDPVVELKDVLVLVRGVRLVQG